MEIKIKKKPKAKKASKSKKVSKQEANPKQEVKKSEIKQKTTKLRRQRRIKPEIIHSYVFKHEVVSEEEKIDLLNKGIISEKIPFILISDPAICHLDIKVGDIIRIKRKNPVVGESFYYRKVILD